MSDTDLINWLEANPAALKNLDVDLRGRWTFYDRRNAPAHRGWTPANDFREALKALIGVGCGGPT